MMRSLSVVISLAAACSAGKDAPSRPVTDTGGWWADENEDDEDDEDDGGGFGPGDLDEDDAELEACDEDFDPGMPCDGDWFETICLHEGVIWWCEDGSWWNEETAPDDDD